MTSSNVQNAFLAGLAPATWERLAPDTKVARLELGKLIYRPDEPVRTVYFPLSCLISQVNRSEDGQGVETAMVGRDNAAGVLESLGTGKAVWESMVQVDGEAIIASAKTVRRLAGEDAAFNFECWRLAETQAFESQQSVACQALHAGEKRLARWLHEAHTRTGARNPLPVTQEVVATMLGIQRTTVSTFQGSLQRRGLITVKRGRVEIADVDGLAAACNCLRLVEERRREGGYAD